VINTPAPHCRAFRALPLMAKINVVGLCVAVFSLSALLCPLWSHDDNLTHGLFLPVLAVILVSESRRDRDPRFLRSGPALFATCTVLALSSLICLAIAVVYAAAMGWNHAMAEFMLSSALVFALGAGWIGFSDQKVRFIPFNWAACVAVIVWFFAGPPPPGTYARLALFLQTQVTGGVVWILNTLGIAAYHDGNVIELARSSVGVSEACSGVRSLISCTVAGLFISAILLRRPLYRAGVIVISPAIGLGMNFIRSLVLTLLVNGGISIDGRWHDLTGASILVVTTLLVAAVAYGLHRRETPQSLGMSRGPEAFEGRSLSQGILTAALLTAVLLIVFPLTRSHSAATASVRRPDLDALLPPPSPGWSAQTTPGLDQFSETLHTHSLIERVYSDGAAPGSTHVTLYLAYWQPGEAPVSLVDAHTPDACWPGSGWVQEAVPQARVSLGVGDRILAPAESRLFSHGGFRTHVWFWHLYGGKPLAFVDPYSVARLLGLAWHYGFGPSEDQLFVRISSNRPWQEIASQPTLQHFISNLQPLGL
jgi:exosortase